MQDWFLILSLFLPRIALLIAWFGGSVPYNTVPFIGDVLLSIFIPRVLVLLYIATNLGTNNNWFFAHLLVAAILFVKGFRVSYKRS